MYVCRYKKSIRLTACNQLLRAIEQFVVDGPTGRVVMLHYVDTIETVQWLYWLWILCLAERSLSVNIISNVKLLPNS